MMRDRFLIVGLVFTTLCPLATAEDWSRFLGPGGQLRGEATNNTPTKFGQDENIRWKAELPGRGVSSPIVVGAKVFVTCYSGYGMGDGEGSLSDLKRHLVCVDRATGELLWTRTVDAIAEEDLYEGIGVPAHGYASHTPVSDGERVFAFFGKSGVHAFDLDGNPLWQTDVGNESGPQRWGSSCSPILYKDMVIVLASEESRSMIALDAKTGSERWRQEAGDFESTWSTPVIVQAEDGRVDLCVNVPGEVWGLNPDTGKLRWYARGTEDNSTAASLVPGDGIVIATGGRGGNAVAVRVGGKGDVNESHVLWEAQIPGRFATPVLHDGKLFTYGDAVLSVFDVETGDRISQTRLTDSSARGGARDEGGSRGEGGSRDDGRRGGFGRGGMMNMDYASPVLVGDRIYILTRGGTVYVTTATDEPEVVATNRFDGDTGFGGTPAVSDGELLIRSDSALYCVSKSET